MTLHRDKSPVEQEAILSRTAVNEERRYIRGITKVLGITRKQYRKRFNGLRKVALDVASFSNPSDLPASFASCLKVKSEYSD